MGKLLKQWFYCIIFREFFGFNFSNIFYLTKYSKNITISSCKNQYKIINEVYYIFYMKSLKSRMYFILTTQPLEGLVRHLYYRERNKSWTLRNLPFQFWRSTGQRYTMTSPLKQTTNCYILPPLPQSKKYQHLLCPRVIFYWSIIDSQY